MSIPRTAVLTAFFVERVEDFAVAIQRTLPTYLRRRAATVAGVGFDPSSPPTVLEAFVRARASLDPDAPDTVTLLHGVLYASAPGVGLQLLLHVYGFRIARAVRLSDGYDILAREALAFSNPGCDHFTEWFENPFTGRRDGVRHVWHDPANETYTEADINGARIGDSVHFTTAQARLTRWIVSVAELDADQPSIASTLASVRHEPWLQWMDMDGHPGGLLLDLGGAVLPGGYGALPASLRDLVCAHRPEFAFAPRTFSD